MALKLKGSTSGFVAIDAPSVAGNNTLILPENTGSAHQILANDITAGVTTFTQITVSRNGDLTVPGTISIGGTLTYEDVTSVDSVGIVTARGLSIFGNTTGLNVASGISTFQALTGTTGTFSGAVSGTTGTFTGDVSIAENIIHTGDTNTKISFPAADTIAAQTGGTERLRITSTGDVNIGGNLTQTDSRVHIQDVTRVLQEGTLTLSSASTTDGAANNGSTLRFHGHDGSTERYQASIRGAKENGSSGNYAGYLAFNTRPNGQGMIERMRIASDGDVGIGTISPQTTLHTYSEGNAHVVLHESAGGYDSRLRIKAPPDRYCQLEFADDDADAGEIRYFHNDNYMSFHVNNNVERLRITSAGLIGVNQTSPEGVGIDITSSRTNSYSGTSDTRNLAHLICRNGSDGSGRFAALSFINGGGTQAEGSINLVQTGNYTGDLTFKLRTAVSAWSEFLRITSGGKILMGGSASYDNFENSSTSPRLQIRGTNLSGSCQAWIRATADAGGPKLFIANTRSTAEGGHTVVQSGDEAGQIHFAGSDGSQFVDACQIRGAIDGTPGADDMPGRLTFHTTGDGSATCTERMRIHNNGRMSFNNTTFPYGETFHFYNGLEGSCASFYQNSSNDHTNLILRHGRGLSGYNGYQMLFKRNDGTNVGSIISGASSTSFNTSSDYRLKENQITIPNAIDKLNKLKPYEFNFKDDPDYKHLGFFAHEVQEIIPNGVAYGEKDEVYTEDSPSESDDYKKGDMKIQSLDYGKLTPLLTAALQEAITEIESLKSRLDAAGL